MYMGGNAVNLPLTYGQCLRRIMQKYHLSINDLSRKMGYHSTTQVTRILNDEVSASLVTRFHHKVMLFWELVLTPAEIKELSVSLQFTCLGEESFLTRRAMHRMLFESPKLSANSIPLRITPPSSPDYTSFDDLLNDASHHQHIDLLVIGSFFDAQLPLFYRLVAPLSQAGGIRICHCFAMAESHARIVPQISALIPYLNTDAYEGLYCTRTSEETYRFLQQNSIAITRCIRKDGTFFTTVFTPQQTDGIHACRIEGNDVLYRFYEALIARHRDNLRPIKSVYPQPKSLENLLTMCQRDLFLEQNRACCFTRLDLCFPALPTAIVLAAVDNGARMGLAPDDPLLEEMRRVHEARHQNLFTKSEPTCFILSKPALTAFAKTGHMSDHLFAMRDLTVKERTQTLTLLYETAKANPAFNIHLLEDESLNPVSSFVVYKDMGMQISANHTAYNIEESHSEVFIGQPEFTESFFNYCNQVLIPEYCLDRDASLTFLKALLASLHSMDSSSD